MCVIVPIFCLVSLQNRFALIPRFRNLHHFNNAVHIQFNDGSKFEDLAKVCSAMYSILHI